MTQSPRAASPRGAVWARRGSMLTIACVLLAACGQNGVAVPESVEGLQETVQAGGEALRSELAQPTATGDDAAATPPQPAPAPPPSPEEAATAQDAPPPAAVPPLPEDTAGLGAMCRPYLRGDYPSLVVEVDHQAGARPTQEALDHLLAVLRSVLDKPAGIELVVGEIPGEGGRWDREALRATAAQHRETVSTPQRLSLYVLAVRGQFVDGGSLGVAYTATEFALFPDEIGLLSGLLGGRGAVERAVMVHEAGHLLCLVNITYTSAIDHEDPDHPHHSGDRASVMYWAIETSAVAQVFSGPPPDDFTANDRSDLDGLRTGRY